MKINIINNNEIVYIINDKNCNKKKFFLFYVINNLIIKNFKQIKIKTKNKIYFYFNYYLINNFKMFKKNFIILITNIFI